MNATAARGTVFLVALLALAFAGVFAVAPGTAHGQRLAFQGSGDPLSSLSGALTASSHGNEVFLLLIARWYGGYSPFNQVVYYGTSSDCTLDTSIFNVSEIMYPPAPGGAAFWYSPGTLLLGNTSTTDALQAASYANISQYYGYYCLSITDSQGAVANSNAIVFGQDMVPASTSTTTSTSTSTSSTTSSTVTTSTSSSITTSILTVMTSLTTSTTISTSTGTSSTTTSTSASTTVYTAPSTTSISQTSTVPTTTVPERNEGGGAGSGSATAGGGSSPIVTGPNTAGSITPGGSYRLPSQAGESSSQALIRVITNAANSPDQPTLSGAIQDLVNIFRWIIGHL